MMNKKTAIHAALLASLTTFPLTGASLTNCTAEELMVPRFQQWDRYLPHLSSLKQGNCLQIGEVQGCTTQWLVDKVALKKTSHVVVMDRENKGVLESLRKIEASREYTERLQAFTKAFESTNDGESEYSTKYKESMQGLFKKFESLRDGIFEDPTEYKESMRRLFKKFESLRDEKCEYSTAYKEKNELLFKDFELLHDENFEYSAEYKERMEDLLEKFESLHDGKCEYSSAYKEKIELLFKDFDNGSESILLEDIKYPGGFLERLYGSENAFESIGEEKTVTVPYSKAFMRKALWASQGPFAFIYIDGDRSMQTNLEDLVLAWNLLAKGGILVFNNYALSSEDTDEKLAIARQALDFACEGRNRDRLYALIGKIVDWIDIEDDYNVSLKQSSEWLRLAMNFYCKEKSPYNFNFLVTILSRTQRVLDKPILWEKFDTWVGNQTITSDLKTVAPHVVDVVLNGLNAFRNDPTTFNTLVEGAFAIVSSSLPPLLSSQGSQHGVPDKLIKLIDLFTEVFPNVEVKNSAKTVVDGFLSIYEGQYQLLHKGYQVHLQKMVDDDFPLRETEDHSWVPGQAWQ